MAECMDEFDEATPLRETYCSRLTTDEYEEQGARWAPISTTTLSLMVWAAQLHRAGLAGPEEAPGRSARALQGSHEETSQGGERAGRNHGLCQGTT